MAFSVGFDTSALDPEFKAHAARGIGRYVQELKTFFDSVSREDLEIGFFDHRSMKAPPLLDSAIACLPAGRQTIRQQIVYPMRLGGPLTGHFDTLHFPAHMDAPSWSSKKYILTVLDLIPLVCADLYKADRPGWRYRLARWLEIRAIKNASLVLAISENTAKDVHEILSVPYERIVVTPLGVDIKFFEARLQEPEQDLRFRFGLPAAGPIVLYVGGIDPRKNYTVLLRAFAALLKLCDDGSIERPTLLMAGKIQGDREFPKLMKLAKELGISECVVTPGYIKDDELLQLYALSSVFFFPSLYEGFGLPVLEAMAAGTPVVSSNTSAMPEVLGDCGISFDPHDEVAAAKALFDVISNQELSHHLSEKARLRARAFTWQRTGEKTIEAYKTFASRAQ